MEFKNTEIKMHKDETTQFGIFRFEVDKTEITEAEQEINIMLDKSGSMDELCGDGSSKMQQIKHVTNNILRFIAKNCTKENILVSIKTFNVEVETVFEKTVVTEELLDNLIKKVEKIYSSDGTDIGTALKAMQTTGHNIFMSDGDANIGETCPTILANLVDKNAFNTFVGFGLDHNPEIFTALSDTKNSSYYFIDKVEKSGNAYGEILHGILYNCLSDVRVQITGGTIYNWKTNEWVTEIFVGNMSGETKKTFHIKSAAKEDIQIVVTGTGKEGIPFSTKYVFEGQTDNLQNMIYRQRTQELLYKSKQMNNEKKEIGKMKKELNAFMSELKKYMKEAELVNDPLLKNLCDDIAIVYRTIGTRYGQMYSSSRQTSQGNERLYNVSDTPRRERMICWAEEYEEDAAIDGHVISDEFEDTPYYSGRVATLMRSVTKCTNEDGVIEDGVIKDGVINDGDKDVILDEFEYATLMRSVTRCTNEDE